MVNRIFPFTLLATLIGYRILHLIPASGSSPWTNVRNFVRNLFQRKHVATPPSFGGPKPENCTEISTQDPDTSRRGNTSRDREQKVQKNPNLLLKL